MRRVPLLVLACLLGFPFAARAQGLTVAVAANAEAPLQEIAAAFERESGTPVKLVAGATGTLYAQVVHGAPFDVFLAADDATPARLVREERAVAASRMTYAVGRLVLWSADPALVDGQGNVLRTGRFAHLSLANPALAPYGAAAIAVLRNLGLEERLRPRFVQGENIAQAHQFVATGAAELGFVALSQVMRQGKPTGGSLWAVPDDLHAPLRQDGVVLARAAGHRAAEAFMRYLAGDAARAVLRGYGYAF